MHMARRILLSLAFLMPIREADAGDAEFQVEHPEHPHAVVRDGVLVAHHFDAAEAEGFEKRFHDLKVRKRLMG